MMNKPVINERSLSPVVMPSYLVEYATEIGEIKTGELLLSVDNTQEPSWLMVEQCLKVEAISRVIAGFELHKLKDQLGHGKFQAGLAERGIKIDTANQCMYVAKMFSRINISKTDAYRFLNLKFNQLLIIRQWETEEIEAFAENQPVKGLTLDEVKDLSIRDMQSKIAESESRVIALENKLAEARKVIADKDEKLAKANTLFAHTGMPPIVNDMRVMSTTLTTEILRLLDALNDLELTLAKGYESGLALESEPRARQLRAALVPWATNINVIQARLQQINSEARGHFAAELFPTSADDVMQLSEGECLNALSNHAFMTDLMHTVTVKQYGKREKKPQKKGAKS